MKSARILTIGVMFILVIAAAAYAKKPDEMEMRRRAKERIETMMLLRVSEEMGLPEEKERELFKFLKVHFRESEKLSRDQLDAMHLLDKLYSEKAPTGELEKVLNSLEKIRQERMQMENRMLDDLKHLLTTRELAHFVLTWPKVEEEIRTAIRQLREGKMPAKKFHPK